MLSNFLGGQINMEVKVENVEKNVVKLVIEVESDVFDEGMERSFKKNAHRFNVPGFRKGKAPRPIVERHYGEQVLYEDAINIVCGEAYDKAIKDNNVDPVSRPEIDIEQIGSGQSFIFSATVTVKPEVVLGDYKGVKVEKKESNVTDEDVDKEIEKMREKNSRLVVVENRAVQDGDTVVIDFEGFIDGVAFEGGKGEDWNLVIGSNQFIPGFEEQLIGAEKDEDREINVDFPEDYHNKEFAGKKSMFKVKIKEIKVKELPELDDEFAKDSSEFETLDELKKDLREKLSEREERRIKGEIENDVINKVAENATIEIPEVMVQNRVDNILQDFDMRLRYQGLSLAKYLEMSDIDVSEFRKQFDDRALEEVRSQLVLEKIVQVEDISATDEEYEEELKKQADIYKHTVEEFKKHLSEEDIEYIKKNIAIGKAIDLIVEHAELV